MRAQPVMEQVVQQGKDCILLLLAMFVAAWNNPAVDSVLLDHQRAKKRKRGAELEQVSGVVTHSNLEFFQQQCLLSLEAELVLAVCSHRKTALASVKGLVPLSSNA